MPTQPLAYESCLFAYILLFDVPDVDSVPSVFKINK